MDYGGFNRGSLPEEKVENKYVEQRPNFQPNEGEDFQPHGLITPNQYKLGKEQLWLKKVKTFLLKFLTNYY